MSETAQSPSTDVVLEDAPASGGQRRPWARIPHAGLLCVLVAFFVAAAWSLVTPPFQVPDEESHFAYVQSLAENGKPPDDPAGPAYSTEEARTIVGVKFGVVVGRTGDRGVWTDVEQRALDGVQEQRLRRDDGTRVSNASSQPPAYYALGAGVYWLSPSHDLLTRFWLLRLLGAVLGAATTLCVFLFLRELLPGTLLACTTGALVVAFQPIFGFTTAGVNPDALLFFAAALLFVAVARAFNRGLNRRTGALIGAATALGLLTKINFLAFVPGAALAVAILLWRANGERRPEALRGARVAAAIAALPAFIYIGLNVLVWDRSWWAQSLQTQVQHARDAKGVAGVPIKQQLGYIWQLYLPRLPFMLDQFPYYPLYETWWKRSFGVFGWVDYGFPRWAYALGLGTFLVICAPALAALYQARDVLDRRKAEIAVLALFAGLLLIELGVFGIRYRAETGFEFEQGRYLMPLLALYALVPSLAVRGVGSRLAPVAAGIIVVAAAAHGLFALLLTVSRFYG